MMISGSLYGNHINWKVDSGARNTFITLDSYNKIPKKHRPELKPTKHKFSTANGQEIKCKGEGLMALELEGKELFFVVLVGDVTSNLLGEDFIRHFKCNFDFSSHEFVIQLGGKVEPDQQKGHKLQKFVAAVTCYIPARHEIICPVKTKNKEQFPDGLHDEQGILIPDRKFVQSHGLAVARTLVDTSGSAVCARILNPGDTTVKINKGTPVALFSKVEEVGQSFSFEQEEMSKELKEPKQQEGLMEQKTSDDVSTEIPDHLKQMFEQGCQNLSPEQTAKFKDFVLHHQGNFAKPGEVGRTNFGSHKIKLKDETPIKDAPRRIPIFKRDILDEEVKRLEEKGLIEKSNSPWSAQTVLVRKKDGSWRLCVDYRKLNEKTIKDAYPIPRINDNIDALSGSHWFTSLDCDMAYHQVPLAEEDKEKTAFATPRGGLYQYVTMPFGLCNAPATFQRLIERTLAGLQWYIAVLYLDDIIVFSKTFDGQLDNLRRVFERLTEAGLLLKAKKFVFFRHETSFLGHIVSKEGVKPDPAKITAVMDIQMPKTVTELRSFLGLTSYYRKFVKDYAKVAKPLYDLTRPKVTWDWTESCEKAFLSLKENLIHTPILAYPDVNGSEFILDTDASSYAIGGVLSQIQGGYERVIAYASRTLEKAEQNYCVTRKEMLATVFFTKYFKHYLLGRHFILRTDHGSLRWLHRFKEPEGQVQRWLQQLSQFDFEIIHRPGTNHGNADAMSRLVRGDEVICRQCEMPWTTPVEPFTAIFPGEEQLELHLDSLGNSDDGNADGSERSSTTQSQAPLPHRRKPGRRPNKPPSAPPRQRAEKELDTESLKSDNPYFEGMVNQIYPPELQLNKANISDTEAPFLDLHLSVANGFVSSKIYDKRDDFDFDIVNFPFLDGDVPRRASYGVYISQLIRFARVCNHVTDFNARNKCLTAKLLQQGYRYHKLRKTFSKFYRRHYELISKYNVGLKTLLSEGLSEPEFYGDLVYKFKKLKGINDFSFQFRKIITRYKRIGYNLNVMRQSACLVFNPIMVDSYAAFFNCTPVGRASDSMMAPT